MKILFPNRDFCNAGYPVIDFIFHIHIIVGNVDDRFRFINDKFIDDSVITFVPCQIHAGKTKLIFSIFFKFHLTFPDTIDAMPCVIWMMICLAPGCPVMFPIAHSSFRTRNMKTHIIRIKVFFGNINCDSSFSFIIFFIFCFIVVI